MKANTKIEHRQGIIDNIIKLEPSLTQGLLNQLSWTTLVCIEDDMVQRNKVYPKDTVMPMVLSVLSD